MPSNRETCREEGDRLYKPTLFDTCPASDNAYLEIVSQWHEEYF
jgi:hypothetical protein